MTAIGGSGFGVDPFATNIAYRAFGGVKSMTYATASATNITMGYDTRLRPSSFEVESSANTVDIHNKTYTYVGDGGVKQVTDNAEAMNGQVYERFLCRLI
jgi:hypothetical protein